MHRALRIILLAVVVLQAVLVAGLALLHGPAVSPDSLEYLAGADSLLRGQGLLASDGSALTLFPPGLPVLLFLGQVAGASVEVTAGLVNVVALTVVIVGTYVLGRLVLGSEWAGAIAAVLTGLSASFIAVFAWVWTEPLFTAVAVILLILLVRSMSRNSCSWWVVLLAGALTSAAVTLRYAGLVLVPVTAVGIWWSTRARGRGAGVKTAVATGLGLVAPIFLVLRNISLGSAPLGDRASGARTLMDSAVDALSVLGGYVLPPEASSLGVVIGVGSALVLLMGIWVAFIRRRDAVLLVALYACLYITIVVASQTVTRLDETSARLLAPAVPALAILGVFGAWTLLSRARSDLTAWVGTSPSAWVRLHGAMAIRTLGLVVVCVVILGLVAASVRADLRLLEGRGNGDAGIAASSWSPRPPSEGQRHLS